MGCTRRYAFARSSVAYKQDGTQVATNTPRYETGKFGQAVMVEEGTMNLSFGMIAATNGYVYIDMTSVTDYVIQTGDYLEYDVFWFTNVPTEKRIAFDYTCSNGSTLRDSGAVAVDQNNLSAHPRTDLSAYASGRWYHRKIVIPSGHVGQTIIYYNLACEYDGGGTVAGMIRNIRITDGAGAVRKNIWSSTDALPTFTVNLTSNALQTYSFSKVEAETLTIPTAGVLTPDKFTIEGWFLIPNQANIRYLVSINKGTYVNHFDFYMNTSSYIRWEYYDGTTVYGITSTNTVNLNAFNYVAWTYDRSTGIAVVNVNGVKTSATVTLPTVPTLTTICLGVDYDKMSNILDGLIDDIRISNIARTDTEILAAYQSNAPLLVDEFTTAKLNFDTFITDWTKYDFYNAEDLNRVESNAQDITAFMQANFKPPTLTTVTNRDMTRIEFYDDLNRIESNILAIRNTLYEPPGWLVPITNWFSLKSFSYADANRLESDLLALYTLLQNIQNYFQYSGVPTCGQDNTFL